MPRIGKPACVRILFFLYLNTEINTAPQHIGNKKKKPHGLKRFGGYGPIGKKNPNPQRQCPT